MHLKMSSGKWRPFSLGLNVVMGVLILRRCLLYWHRTDTICAPNNINQRCIIQCIFHVSPVHPPDPRFTCLMDRTTLSEFGPVCSPLLGVSSGCARPITGQVTSVTWPVIGWAHSELTLSKRQKTDIGYEHTVAKKPRQNGGRFADMFRLSFAWKIDNMSPWGQ